VRIWPRMRRYPRYQETASKYAAVQTVIAKPFTPELLCDTVDQLLGPGLLPLPAEPTPLDLSQALSSEDGTVYPEPTSNARLSGFSGGVGSFSLIHCLQAVQRQRLTGVLNVSGGGRPYKLVCRAGVPIGIKNGPGYFPQEQAIQEFSRLWTSMDVSFHFDTTAEVPDYAPPGQLVENMLEWAIESLRCVKEDAESSYAWGDSSGVPAFNRSGYERVQRVALTQEEIDFIRQVDARSSVVSIAHRLGWSITQAHQVLFRFLCLEIFDFWPASILAANRA
jgi:hypothetical protein